MSLLIYSPRCKHSMEVIDYINRQPQLKQLVGYHNINTQGIPPAYKNKITRVPTMLTKNGKVPSSLIRKLVTGVSVDPVQ